MRPCMLNLNTSAALLAPLRSSERVEGALELRRPRHAGLSTFARNARCPTGPVISQGMCLGYLICAAFLLLLLLPLHAEPAPPYRAPQVSARAPATQVASEVCRVPPRARATALLMWRRAACCTRWRASPGSPSSRRAGTRTWSCLRGMCRTCGGSWRALLAPPMAGDLHARGAVRACQQEVCCGVVL